MILFDVMSLLCDKYILLGKDQGLHFLDTQQHLRKLHENMERSEERDYLEVAARLLGRCRELMNNVKKYIESAESAQRAASLKGHPDVKGTMAQTAGDNTIRVSSDKNTRSATLVNREINIPPLANEVIFRNTRENRRFVGHEHMGNRQNLIYSISTAEGPTINNGGIGNTGSVITTVTMMPPRRSRKS